MPKKYFIKEFMPRQKAFAVNYYLPTTYIIKIVILYLVPYFYFFFSFSLPQYSNLLGKSNSELTQLNKIRISLNLIL